MAMTPEQRARRLKYEYENKGTLDGWRKILDLLEEYDDNLTDKDRTRITRMREGLQLLEDRAMEVMRDVVRSRPLKLLDLDEIAMFMPELPNNPPLPEEPEWERDDPYVRVGLNWDFGWDGHHTGDGAYWATLVDQAHKVEEQRKQEQEQRRQEEMAKELEEMRRDPDGYWQKIINQFVEET